MVEGYQEGQVSQEMTLFCRRFRPEISKYHCDCFVEEDLMQQGQMEVQEELGQLRREDDREGCRLVLELPRSRR